MLELYEAARSERLLSFFVDPPQIWSAANGVIGAAVSYDSLLVAEVARRQTSYSSIDLSDTIEASSAVATTLGEVTKALTEEEGYPTPEVESLLRWWRDTCNRRFKRDDVSPIVIELTIGPGFRSDFEMSKDDLFFGAHRITLRSARQAKLHYAEAGGRFTPRVGRKYSKDKLWGTLGGFVKDIQNSRIYAVTAAHVATSGRGYGAPAFLPVSPFFLRATINSLLAYSRGFLPRRWRGEHGYVSKISEADIVAPRKCTAKAHYRSGGLDVALVEWPESGLAERRHVSVARIDQLSQLLPLHFIGAQSGKQNVSIQSYSFWHSYSLSETEQEFACISDCLQIKLRQRPYIRTDVSKRGDSGAWVLAEGLDGPWLVGMLVGGDGERSGIVPAYRFIDYFEMELGTILHPLI